MNRRQARRVTRELTPAEKERLKKFREQIAQELPDLQARDQMRKDARDWRRHTIVDNSMKMDEAYG